MSNVAQLIKEWGLDDLAEKVREMCRINDHPRRRNGKCEVCGDVVK